MSTLDFDPVMILTKSSTDALLGMPMGNPGKPGFYLDIGLISSSGNTRIFSEAVELPEGLEVFRLRLDQFDRAQWWSSKDETASLWKPVDLLTRYPSVKTLFSHPRQLRCFYNPADWNNVPQLNGFLGPAAAVQLKSKIDNTNLVVFATPYYPCSLEVAIDEARCNEIIRGLAECPTLVI
jgi:hypothetical protein